MQISFANYSAVFVEQAMSAVFSKRKNWITDYVVKTLLRQTSADMLSIQQKMNKLNWKLIINIL